MQIKFTEIVKLNIMIVTTNNNTLVLEGYMAKNYLKHCPGFKFCLIPKLFSWSGFKPKDIKLLLSNIS